MELWSTHSAVLPGAAVLPTSLASSSPGCCQALPGTCQLPATTLGTGGCKMCWQESKKACGQEKVVLVNQGMGIYATNPLGLSGNFSSGRQEEHGKCGDHRENPQAIWKSSTAFGRGWIRTVIEFPACLQIWSWSTLMLREQGGREACITAAQAFLVPWTKPPLGSAEFVSSPESLLNFPSKIPF